MRLQFGPTIGVTGPLANTWRTRKAQADEHTLLPLATDAHVQDAKDNAFTIQFELGRDGIVRFMLDGAAFCLNDIPIADPALWMPYASFSDGWAEVE